MIRLEGKEYEVKGTTKCDCGHEFTLNNIIELKKINQSGFYGNVLNNYSEAVCPNCKKRVVLFLKQKGQTWEIIDIGVEHIKTTNDNKEICVEEPIKTIDNKKISTDELICSVCGKACKSQIGYNSHMKTHQN